jgi:tetratricopeptide (TPR) repeat protein
LSPPRNSLPVWKKLVFSAAVVVVFFGLTELALSLLGVRPLLYDEDPFVGFSSVVPLFVEQTDGAGRVQLVTAENRLRLFNRQSFPRDKSPRAVRVFCLGGSTTYGRPYDDTTSFAGWLREFLPVADPSHEWQVVNAGGISYASYRVALTMEELVRYQPDLFVVYTGHNEFLEQRTYGALRDTPLPLRRLEEAASRTRIYSALERLQRKLGETSGTIDPARDLLPAEVDAVLDHTVGPESYTRDDQLREQILEHYRVSLVRMIALARQADADIIFVTPASNLRDFTPFKSQHAEGLNADRQEAWLEHMEQAGTEFRTQQFERALTALDQAAQIDDRHAILHFLRGRVLLRLEHYAEARQAFIRARDEDVCPLRAITPMRQIVLDVAARHQVPVVDFVALMDRNAQDGIPGFDWFLDHVHPKIEGHRQLALELMEVMETQGMASVQPEWGQPAIAQVTDRVMGGLDYRAHANALRNLAKVLGWAGKFHEADQRARLAVLGLPNDANAHYLAGNAFWRDGNLDVAIAEFQQAVEIDPDYTDAWVQLGYAQREKDQPEAARDAFQRALQLEPDQADLYFELGEIYRRQQQWDKAASMYRQTLRVAPDSAAAYKQLGWLAGQRDRWQEAIRYYEQGLEINPEDDQLHTQLAEAFEASRDYAAATDHYQLALILNPQFTDAYLGLGRIAETQRDRQAAAAYYLQALRLAPDSAEAKQGLARNQISP